MLHEHKRVRHGQAPGDVSKLGKIMMREGKSYKTSWGQLFGPEQSKSFRKYLAEKGRTVQRRRDRRTIENELAQC